MGIIHRDLKLENIMMTNKSRNAIPKIIDFGLSKILLPEQFLKESLGTVGYCSPEIILGYSYRFEVDLWSLGVILYRMICGDLPFDNEDKDIALMNTLNK